LDGYDVLAHRFPLL